MSGLAVTVLVNGTKRKHKEMTEEGTTPESDQIKSVELDSDDNNNVEIIQLESDSQVSSSSDPHTTSLEATKKPDSSIIQAIAAPADIDKPLLDTIATPVDPSKTLLKTIATPEFEAGYNRLPLEQQKHILGAIIQTQIDAEEASLEPPVKPINPPENIDDMRYMAREKKRQRLLMRNRVAAKACREKKKELVHDMEEKIKSLTEENEKLTKQVDELKNSLKTAQLLNAQLYLTATVIHPSHFNTAARTTPSPSIQSSPAPSTILEDYTNINSLSP